MKSENKTLLNASVMFGAGIGLTGAFSNLIVSLIMMAVTKRFSFELLLILFNEAFKFSFLLACLVFYFLGYLKMKFNFKAGFEGNFCALLVSIPINLYVYYFMANTKVTLFGINVMATSVCVILAGDRIYKKVQKRFY